MAEADGHSAEGTNYDVHTLSGMLDYVITTFFL